MNTTQITNHIKSTLAIAAIVATALPVMAQRPRVSPHETISAVIDGNKVTVVYGRPYTKAPKSAEMRKIWGGLVPFGKVWRTGADEATKFTTEKPIVMNGTKIPAGSYTLYTLPADGDSAKLIVNKQLGQWGTMYDEKQDLARIDLKKGTLEKPVTQFTMTVAENPAGGGVLKLMWEETEFSMPFTVEK
jgi:hypothetical protein